MEDSPNNGSYKNYDLTTPMIYVKQKNNNNKL